MTRSAATAEIRWDEYAHFAAFNWDHDRIARRLGVDPASLRTAMVRRTQRQSKNARTEKVR